jgi:dolichyl-phosphate-mannose--protein O-mannosyl transferase
MFRHQWRHALPQVESSAPLSWPLLVHPIRHVWDGATAWQVVLVGNPPVWWGLLAGLPVLVYRVARQRPWPEVVLGG